MILESIGADATSALLGGTIENRTDSHITRTPLVLDEQGFSDLSALLDEVLERANAIQEEAAARLNKEKGDRSAPMMAILHFETPSES